jgi:predicted phosphate transport protein (TIGR00153 family)
MGIKEWIIPNDKQFFNMLKDESNNVFDGSKALLDMLKHYENISEKKKNIKDIEHKGDNLVHNIFEELNKTFITPIDHSDISLLASSLDDILDRIDGVAIRLVLYDINKPEDNMIFLADALVLQMGELNSAITELHDAKNFEEIKLRCIEVNRLENVADDIHNNSVADLFTRKDAIEIMKLKEIYECLEHAIDKCEDAADVINGIITKNS